MHKYEIILYWSDDDDAFIAEVPELPGCMAHGGSADAALANCQDAVELWIDTAKEFGRQIPIPKGRRLHTHRGARDQSAVALRAGHLNECLRREVS